MVKIDLITGFLGSGKTTFIKKYATYLMDKGMKLGILENDHGAVNVDMMLLQDIMGDNCELEMVAGGCDLDCHRRRLKTKLIAMGMSGYDRVLVEPSGIFDVEEFFDVLHEEPIDRWFEIGNVITIVDARAAREVSDNSRYLLATQLAGAGVVLLSKTEENEEALNKEASVFADSLLKEFGCDVSVADRIIAKSWEKLSDEDFERIMCAGYRTDNIAKKRVDSTEEFQTKYLFDIDITKEQLLLNLKNIFDNKAYGNVMRIKGFLKTDEGYLQINATKEDTQVTPIEKGQKVIIVIGEKLVEDRLKELFEVKSQ